MEERLRQRLEELQQEWETGQAQLQQLDEQRAKVMQALLRIEGAITLSKELLEAVPVPGSNGATAEVP